MSKGKADRALSSTNACVSCWPAHFLCPTYYRYPFAASPSTLPLAETVSCSLRSFQLALFPDSDRFVAGSHQLMVFPSLETFIPATSLRAVQPSYWAPAVVSEATADSHTGAVRALCTLRGTTKQRFVSGSDDCTLKVWCVTRRSLQRSKSNLTPRLRRADSAPASDFAPVPAPGSALSHTAAAELKTPELARTSSDVSASYTLATSTVADGHTPSAEAESGSVELQIVCEGTLRGHRSGVRSVVAVPGESEGRELVASAAQDGPIYLWCVDEGGLQHLAVFGAGHRAPVRVLWYSAHVKCIVSGSDDTTLKLTAAHTGVERCSFSLSGSIIDISELSDGRLLVLTKIPAAAYNRASNPPAHKAARGRGKRGKAGATTHASHPSTHSAPLSALLAATGSLLHTALWLVHPTSKRVTPLLTRDYLHSIAVLPDILAT